MSDDRPIGVFDSGLGGLTVVRHLFRLLPQEGIVYLGDTARVPYGSRSPQIVKKFARQDAYFLAGHGVKFIVIACNTASAQAESDLVRRLAIPVLGVIQPGADAATATTQSQRIGILGTRGTIASGAYQRALSQRLPTVKVFSQPCPLFVPLAEEGAQDTAAAHLVVRSYLQPVIDAAVDTIILGCTHYPILAPAIRTCVGESVALVDPGLAIVKHLQCELKTRKLEATGTSNPRHHFFVTDRTAQFQELAERFLGSPLEVDVEQIELD